ncbi:hypothetical protein NP233_g2539 [Leucocoprinus birnbaumii]|uniref:Extracellular serine-rich protein n=1 Tax=Leucocoprinus birnbaumii TaxID=56174 RepID=A0AAD5YYR6_9AGAR|nr:hypothetical protein NP233_g2539 [Leucocoprinus birnbaumii]
MGVRQVSVGVEGSFFDPQTVSAAEGDVINFIFGGDFHTITQSSPENPCSPLPGGFSSGFLGRGPDFSNNTEIFSLTLTNASAPVWYFCAATKPVSHCNHQMVGVINPPSQAAFMSFAAAAVLATTTTEYFPTLVPTGSGAVASVLTLNDARLPPMSQFLPNSSVTDTSLIIASSTAPPTPSPSSSSSTPRGAVIGGAIGAAIGAFLLLCVGFLLWRRIRLQRRTSTGSSFFAYNHRPNGNRRGFYPGSDHENPQMSSTINYSTMSSPNTMITTFDADREAQHTMSRQPPPPVRSVKSTSPMMSEFSQPQSNMGSPLQPMGNLSHANSAGQLTQASGAISDSSGSNTLYTNSSYQPAIHHHQQTSSFGVPMIAEEMLGDRLHPQRRPQQQPADSSSNRTESESGAGVGTSALDVKAIAREVVNIMREEQSQKGQGSANQHDGSGSRSVTHSLESAPPRYHTVNNTAEG